MTEATNATTILLVRHGDVPGISPARFRGRIDFELTERGIAEARMTADWIARHRPAGKIYTSPLKRCRATAAAIAERCHVSPEVISDLQDLNYGEWQGRTHAEVAQAWPELYACWHRLPQLMRIPAGESLQELESRLADALRLILHRQDSKIVVVVCHESGIRALLLQLLDLPASSYHTLAQDTCAINEICCAGDRPIIKTLNQTTHLMGI